MQQLSDEGVAHLAWLLCRAGSDAASSGRVSSSFLDGCLLPIDTLLLLYLQQQQSAKQNWLHLHQRATCTVEWSLSSIATLMIKQQLASFSKLMCASPCQLLLYHQCCNAAQTPFNCTSERCASHGLTQQRSFNKRGKHEPAALLVLLSGDTSGTPCTECFITDCSLASDSMRDMLQPAVCLTT